MSASIHAPLRLCALAGALLLAGDVGAAIGVRFVAGGGGWQLERFEGDVVVLRTTLSSATAGRTGLLLLSCAGTERRIRIAFPDDLRGDRSKSRSVLIRPIGGGATAEPPLIAGLSLEQGRLLTFLETGTGAASIVLRLAELLARQPAALEILTHPGPDPIAFRRVVPYVLSLTFGANDGPALNDFVAACAPAAR